MKVRVRKLLKFRDSTTKAPRGAKRKALKRNLTVPQKFAKVFRITGKAYREALKLEKKTGFMPQAQLQEIILKWAKDLLGIISVDVEIKGAAPDMKTPVLFVGNHVSYVDIPLLMASVPVVFVAKEEVSKWLVIGRASKIAGTVFVKRENDKSRANAASAIAEAILERKQSIGIFPAGTTCIKEQNPWRHGAFKLAQKHGIPVQPFRIRYEPMRKVAYIDKDTFATHLLNLLRQEKVRAIIEFGKTRMISDAVSDCEDIRQWTREIL
jgi:1-acyl-sn-glycerol-3-phosphate acyltransferase